MVQSPEVNTYKAIIDGYYELIELFEQSEDNVVLDLEKTCEVVERYWRDVDRLHRYHNMDPIDRHKIAGYLTYWICKIQPIFIFDMTKTNSKARQINELLALTVAAGRINSDEEYLKKGLKVKLRREFIEPFIYTLRYRPINGDLLSLLYYFIDIDSTLNIQTN